VAIINPVLSHTPYIVGMCPVASAFLEGLSDYFSYRNNALYASEQRAYNAAVEQVRTARITPEVSRARAYFCVELAQRFGHREAARALSYNDDGGRIKPAIYCTAEMLIFQPTTPNPGGLCTLKECLLTLAARISEQKLSLKAEKSQASDPVAVRAAEQMTCLTTALEWHLVCQTKLVDLLSAHLNGEAGQLEQIGQTLAGALIVHACFKNDPRMGWRWTEELLGIADEKSAWCTKNQEYLPGRARLMKAKLVE